MLKLKTLPNIATGRVRKQKTKNEYLFIKRVMTY